MAFTGGNGPALTAYLLDSVFDGAVVGCIGGTNTVSAEQREHAAYVCDLLGKDFYLKGKTSHLPIFHHQN